MFVRGRRAYADFLNFQQTAHKHVYLLGIDSHFFMDGIYNTTYWRANGGVLPGWIIGTAGAVRYPLPADVSNAKAAKTNVDGYLLATVSTDHTIDFRFREGSETDIPAGVAARFSALFVRQCFAGNQQD